MKYCLVSRSLYPGIFPLFISTFLITFPERTLLSRKFKRGVKDKGIGHWVNGIERERRRVWEKRRMARDGQNKKEKNHARNWCG